MLKQPQNLTFSIFDSIGKTRPNTPLPGNLSKLKRLFKKIVSYAAFR